MNIKVVQAAIVSGLIGLVVGTVVGAKNEHALLVKRRSIENLAAETEAATAKRVAQAKVELAKKPVVVEKERVIDTQTLPDCFEAAQNLAFGVIAPDICNRSGLFSSEGRAALAACNAIIRDGEKQLKEAGRCQ